MQQERKKLFAFGKTGSGKSYLLNLLLGFKSSNKEKPFTTGGGCNSCTTELQIQDGTLFGKGKMNISVLDMPGLHDTADKKDQKDNTANASIKNLEKLSEKLKTHWNSEIDRVLLCIPINEKFTHEHKDMVEISRIFTPQSLKVLIIITKCNMIEEEERDGIIQMWTQEMRKQKIEQVFFFGNSLECLSEGFELNIKSSIPEKIRLWSELSKIEQKRLATMFHQACFSLDMQISLKNQKLVPPQEVPNNCLIQSSGEKENTFLGETPSLFHSFKLTNDLTLECTKNHLVFCSKKQNSICNKFIPAEHLKLGDSLLYCRFDDKGNCQNSEVVVVTIDLILKKGFWCPLTSSGQLVVNGLLVSSYDVSVCEQANQNIAHFAMYPLIIYRQLFGASLLTEEKVQSTYQKFGHWLLSRKGKKYLGYLLQQ